MRQPLALFLQTGLLTRRYLDFLLPRVGALRAQLGVVPTGHAAAAYRRGLTLGWAVLELTPVLLDTPHLKAYKLVFDTRLYKAKRLATLAQRATRPLSTLVVGLEVMQPGQPAWGGCGYGIELGA